MRLSTLLGFGVLGLAAVTGLTAVVTACGGSDDNGGSSGGSTAASATGKVWPESSGSATSSTDEHTYAFSEIFMGETDRTGVKVKDSWKAYGYNLDGLVTNATDSKSPDIAKTCKRPTGAAASNLQDGDEGTDNAFGHVIIDFLKAFAPTPSKTVTDAITSGTFTLLLKLKGLTADANQTNTGLSGTLLVGGNYGARPAFDLTTDWPYVKDPQVALDGSYIKDGVFVNGSGGATVPVALAIQGQQLSLTIHKAIITFKHDGATLSNGTVAGILDAEELVTSLGPVAGRLAPQLCSSDLLESVKNAVRQASDILVDGTQDPTRTCDGISVGLGFTAKEILPPTKEAPPAVDPPPACVDGGPAPDAGAQQ